VNRLPSRFNAENRRNALMGYILIVKTPGSRGIIIQCPSVKMRYSSIPFCEVLHFLIKNDACHHSIGDKVAY
jgi:hypothetical protein